MNIKLNGVRALLIVCALLTGCASQAPRVSVETPDITAQIPKDLQAQHPEMVTWCRLYACEVAQNTRQKNTAVQFGLGTGTGLVGGGIVGLATMNPYAALGAAVVGAVAGSYIADGAITPEQTAFNQIFLRCVVKTKIDLEQQQAGREFTERMQTNAYERAYLMSQGKIRPPAKARKK